MTKGSEAVKAIIITEKNVISIVKVLICFGCERKLEEEKSAWVIIHVILYYHTAESPTIKTANTQLHLNLQLSPCSVKGLQESQTKSKSSLPCRSSLRFPITLKKQAQALAVGFGFGSAKRAVRRGVNWDVDKGYTNPDRTADRGLLDRWWAK